MRLQSKEKYLICPKCDKREVKQLLKENDNDVLLSIDKCNYCKYQSNKEELWEYQKNNQDKL